MIWLHEKDFKWVIQDENLMRYCWLIVRVRLLCLLLNHSHLSGCFESSPYRTDNLLPVRPGWSCLLCRPEWLWTCDPSASISVGPGAEVCTSMSDSHLSRPHDLHLRYSGSGAVSCFLGGFTASWALGEVVLSSSSLTRLQNYRCGERDSETLINLLQVVVNNGPEPGYGKLVSSQSRSFRR